MAQETLTRRFDFKQICSGVIYTIQNASTFGKVSKFMHEESFFEGIETEEVTSLRELVRAAKGLYNTSPTSFSYENVLNQIRIQNIDGVRGSTWANKVDEWRHDVEISSRAADKATFDTLLLYLEAIAFGRGAKQMVPNYQKGKMVEVQSGIRETLNNMLAIRDAVNETTVTLDADSIWKKLIENSKNIESKMVRNDRLYLGENSEIDDDIGGFESKTLNLFIGATGNGKTTMCHHILRRCIAQKMTVHLYCVEDREESFMYKFVAANTGIPFATLKKNAHRLSPEDTVKVKKALEEFEKYVIVDFYFGRSIDDIHQRSTEEYLRRRALGLLVPKVHIVDYTGHIASFSKGEKGFEKMRMAYGSRKDFALKNDVICFDFAQINREGGKKIGMSESYITHNDLAGAYDIAQVCDNIISINRTETDRSENRAVLLVCKARDGIMGNKRVVKTAFECGQFLTEKPESTPNNTYSKNDHYAPGAIRG